MAGRLAIIACGGALPVQIAAAHPEAVQIVLKGIPSALEASAELHQLEKIGGLFDALRGHGVDRVRAGDTAERGRAHRLEPRTHGQLQGAPGCAHR